MITFRAVMRHGWGRYTHSWGSQSACSIMTHHICMIPITKTLMRHAMRWVRSKSFMSSCDPAQRVMRIMRISPTEQTMNSVSIICATISHMPQNNSRSAIIILQLSTRLTRSLSTKRAHRSLSRLLRATRRIFMLSLQEFPRNLRKGKITLLMRN